MYTRFDSLLCESITVIIIPLLQYVMNSVTCEFKVMFFWRFSFYAFYKYYSCIYCHYKTFKNHL